ncbi:DUF805 domain-containing protein [Streptomyces phaeoluteigriseus]|uniref:DUF805 domain-containing protein n=2 Tax=Streptomyces phaeoluteigriseus TaxID=114686 RepID=A0ABY4ZLJ2_9ACTN|nr:DUF805 domain-containing protein [Streptomyces phaeoluteigriseus]USQ89580.1 DUF805 domain-containing protein [Streptomyces phaeoluteigriseus]
MSWYFKVLGRYAVFSGRARRTEYWMFTLVTTVVYLALSFADDRVGSDWPSLSYTAVTLLPSLAVTVRRLHDTDRSGWWVLIGVIPCAGLIAMLVLTAGEPTPGRNKYGPNPKEVPFLTDATPR